METLKRWFLEPLSKGFDMEKARRTVESCILDGYEICAWATMNFGYTDQLSRITGGENVMATLDRERCSWTYRRGSQEAPTYCYKARATYR